MAIALFFKVTLFSLCSTVFSIQILASTESSKVPLTCDKLYKKTPMKKNAPKTVQYSLLNKRICGLPFTTKPRSEKQMRVILKTKLKKRLKKWQEMRIFWQTRTSVQPTSLSWWSWSVSVTRMPRPNTGASNPANLLHFESQKQDFGIVLIKQTNTSKIL